MTLKERIKRLELNMEYNKFLGLKTPDHAVERLEKLKEELNEKLRDNVEGCCRTGCKRHEERKRTDKGRSDTVVPIK